MKGRTTAAVGAAVLLAIAAVGWQREDQSGVPAQQQPAPALGGASLVRAKGCAPCHDGPDSEAFPRFPSLANADSWAAERRAGLSAQEYLAESVRAPAAFVAPVFRPSGGPPQGMPALGLSDTEIDAVVAYLLAS